MFFNKREKGKSLGKAGRVLGYVCDHTGVDQSEEDRPVIKFHHNVDVGKTVPLG